MAQRIRHLTTNQGIVGSNPTRDVFLLMLCYIVISSFAFLKKQMEHKFNMITPLNDTKKFPHRDLNPGLTGESRVS